MAQMERYSQGKLEEGPNTGLWATVGTLALLGGMAYMVLSRGKNSAYVGSYTPAKHRHKPEGIVLKRAVTLMRPKEEIYAFWRKLENLPRFMSHLGSVVQIDSRRSHWVGKGPGGVKAEWDAEIVEDRPNELITWRSAEGSELPNHGSVRFEDGGERGVTVRAEIVWDTRVGSVASIVGKLLGNDPEAMMGADLRRFQQMLEAGEVATTEGQPVGKGQLEKGGLKLEGSTL